MLPSTGICHVSVYVFALHILFATMHVCVDLYMFEEKIKNEVWLPRPAKKL